MGDGSLIKMLKRALLTGIILGFILAFVYAGHAQHSKNSHDIADATARAIQSGIRNYLAEYGHLPVEAFSDHSERAAWQVKGRILKVLEGEDEDINPKKHRYIALPEASWHKRGIDVRDGERVVVDPWGQPYYFMLDFDGDGQVPNPDPRTWRQKQYIKQRILVFSGGPDGNPDSWDDNIITW